MNKEQKIEFLKGVASGTRSISELIDAESIHEDLLDYNFCSTLELERLLRLLRNFGEEIATWPETEKQYLQWLKEDILLREPKSYLDRKSFWCNRLPGELYVIRYKNQSKPLLYQLEHGWNEEAHPNVIYPDYNRYFVHYDLSKWKPDIQFDQLSKEGLECICLELINQKELLTLVN